MEDLKKFSNKFRNLFTKIKNILGNNFRKKFNFFQGKHLSFVLFWQFKHFGEERTKIRIRLLTDL